MFSGVFEYSEYICVLCGRSNQVMSQADHVTDWFVSGQPFFRNHSFVSWSASMGATHVHMYWKSGFVEEITSDLVDAALEGLDDIPNFEAADSRGIVYFQYQVEHLGGNACKLHTVLCINQSSMRVYSSLRYGFRITDFICGRSNC